MRILSLLPSTTELVCALGLQHQLVGRSHECDYPASVRQLPAVTRPAVKEKKTSLETSRQMMETLQQGLSVFEVDAELLARLKPDIILTQDHCEVCAVPFGQVEDAVKQHLAYSPRIVSVSPTSLDDVWASFIETGSALGAGTKATALVQEIRERIGIIRNTIVGRPAKRVACIEWLEPVMTAGNWIPEMTEIAGAESVLAEAGKHSPWTTWERVEEAGSDMLFLLPCGYSIHQTKSEMPRALAAEAWHRLKAVQNGEIYILEGSLFFNRPGPRLFESIRIFAEILHPTLFKPVFKENGWIRFEQEKIRATGNFQ